MTVVQHRLSAPYVGAGLAQQPVMVRLASPGFTAGGQTEVLSASTRSTDATGLYSFDLVPQSQIDPAGTHYEVTHPGGEVLSFVVSDAAGPLWLRNLLVSNPAVPSPVVAGGQATVLEGVAMSLYGTSLDVTPGARCTPGLEWFNRLKARLGLAAANTYALSARWSAHAAVAAIGNGPGAFGWPGFVAGSTWPTTRRGVALVDTYANDVANIYDLSVAANPQAMTANDLAQRTHALRALLSTISAGSRVEVEAGVLTGAWTASADAAFSASTIRFTTTPGDRADVPVTFPACGYVDLIVYATDPATITAAAVAVNVDGVLQSTTTSASLTVKAFKEASGTAIFETPARIRVTATPGAHTVRVIHAGTAGQVLYADVFMVPAAVPVPIFVRQDYVFVGGFGSAPAYTVAQTNVITANRAIFDPALATLIAEYPNAVFLPYGGGFDVASMASSVDGVHPNDAGMKQIADDIEPPLRAWAAANHPASLYTTT